MTAQQMWELYSQKEKIQATYDAWAFGVSANELAALVLAGTKTATASAYPLYEVDGEALPKEGQYSIILNSNEEAVCVIRTEKVFVIPYDQVDEKQAWKEGEGDRTLSYWRKVHEQVFREWMEEANLVFNEKTQVVCEEFVRVYP